MYAAGIHSIAAEDAPISPIPLKPGTRWSYEGKAEWTVPGSAEVKSATILWDSEVLESLKGSGTRAAVVRGFPEELAWYEPGQSPGFGVLFCVSNRVYRANAAGKKQAQAWARQFIGKPSVVPHGAEELLAYPLVVGSKWGQDPVRDDTWYCWCVEEAGTNRLSVKGLATNAPIATYTLAYRTCPDHQLLEIAPGLGVVRYVYNHHGTVASTDVRLVSFSEPVDIKRKRSGASQTQLK